MENGDGFMGRQVNIVDQILKWFSERGWADMDSITEKEKGKLWQILKIWKDESND